MKSEFLNQILSVIRLELRKTFFARRGLWIYLLAFAPVLLFFASSAYSSRERVRLAGIARSHPISKEAFQNLQVDMTRQQVHEQLGQPYQTFTRQFRVGRNDTLERGVDRSHKREAIVRVPIGGVHATDAQAV